MTLKITNDDAKKIILTHAERQDTYKELRNSLAGFSRRKIKLLILELVAENQLDKVPFEEIIIKQAPIRQLICISPDGAAELSQIILEKGFTAENCYASCYIGKRKITLTIKEKKSRPN